MGVPQGALNQSGVHARVEPMGGVGMPQGMDGHTQFLISARCLAVRKAPWTLLRRIGEAAVALWV